MYQKVEEIHFPSLPPIPNGQYKTLMADPPWRYGDSLPGAGRGAESHYETLHNGTIAGMGPEIRKITAPNAHLYLWCTNAFIPHAHGIAESWGFTPKTVITWVKTRETPDTLPHERDEPVDVRRSFGMGHYLRNSTEHMIFATKGNLGTDASDAVTHFFAAPDEHSTKPEKAYRLAEYLSPYPRLEMFSRSPREGWDAWGEEAE